MFFGADDACFAEKWAVLIGKEVKRDAGVDLTDTQMLANCLLNCVLIGKYPSAFEPTYQQIVR